MNNLLLKNKELGSSFSVRTLAKKEVKEAQQFLFGELKALYNLDSDYPHGHDIWQMENYYFNTPGNCLIGIFAPDGKLIGTLGMRHYDNRMAEVKERYENLKTAEIVRCYIKGDLRRKGIGGRIFSLLYEEAKKCGYEALYLHTHKFLPGGLNFWLKQGFEITLDSRDKDQTVHMEMMID